MVTHRKKTNQTKIKNKKAGGAVRYHNPTPPGFFILEL